MTIVIARDQYYLDNNGGQFVQGFDPTTVVGRGLTLAAAARRAGAWAFVSGYRAYDAKSGECLGRVYEYEDGKFETQS